MEQLLKQVTEHFLKQIIIESIHPMEPIQVRYYPKPWVLLGAGNYAAVFYHPDYADYAVKVYAYGKQGLQEEAEVYRLLGTHQAYSRCYYAGENFLILQKLQGTTLYECMKKGIRIPPQAIRDINLALDYAVSRNLRPHDVHGKNVMIANGRGLIVDISDFSKQEDCRMWSDFKKAYYKFYWPIASRFVFPLPGFVLEGVRKGYQIYRRYKNRTAAAALRS